MWLMCVAIGLLSAEGAFASQTEIQVLIRGVEHRYNAARTLSVHLRRPIALRDASGHPNQATSCCENRDACAGHTPSQKENCSFRMEKKSTCIPRKTIGQKSLP